MDSALLAIDPLFLIGHPLFLDDLWILLSKGSGFLVFFPFFLLLPEKSLLK